MEVKWSPMIVHVAKSFIKCPNCLQDTHVGAPPTLWEMRDHLAKRGNPEADTLRCENCKLAFKISKRIVFEDIT